MEEPKQEIEITPENFEEHHSQFQQMVANLAVNGTPFYKDGEYFMQFSSEKEIFTINFKREPNNIVPFPQKKKTPQRI